MATLLGLALAGAVQAQDDPFGWGVEESAEPAGDTLYASASAEEGRRLFRALCAGCHGRAGDGSGLAADSMFPRPRDLTRGEYHFRTTASGRLPSRSDVERTLRMGLPGTAMPAWDGLLGDDQIRSLVLYLETLSPRFAEEERAASDVLVDPEAAQPAPVTDALLARGRELYVELQCGKCHGDEGRGDGPAAETLEQSDGQPSHVFDFTSGRYKSGPSRVDLYRTFTTGLDGTPMPSYDASLPDEADRWALEAYCHSLTRDRGLGFYLSQRPTWEEPAAQ